MDKSPNIFSKLKFKKGTSSLHLGTGVERDWKIISFSSALLAIVVVGWCLYMFVQIDKGEIFVIDRTNEQEGRILDTTKLRATVDYYENKNQEFERLQSQVTPSPDPSI